MSYVFTTGSVTNVCKGGRDQWAYEGVILCVIIGDVHQFIEYCLIPLYPWFFTIIDLQRESENHLVRKSLG